MKENSKNATPELLEELGQIRIRLSQLLEPMRLAKAQYETIATEFQRLCVRRGEVEELIVPVKKVKVKLREEELSLDDWLKKLEHLPADAQARLLEKLSGRRIA